MKAFCLSVMWDQIFQRPVTVNGTCSGATAYRHRSTNHYPITVIWQLKPLVTHSQIPDIETEDSFILLRIPG
jgi:hypothetical protein